jgi:hypothetical protein
MFEMFGSILYAAGSYDVEEIVPKERYVARHVNAEKIEKYRKPVFEVTLSEDGEVYTCECGLFPHMGMVCPHMLKVCHSRLAHRIIICIARRWEDHPIFFLSMFSILRPVVTYPAKNYVAGYDRVTCT